jgi:hypothetical protein
MRETSAVGVGGQDRLRCFDLDLEVECAGLERTCLLHPPEREHERLDLVDRGHLGQRHHKAVGQAAGLDQRAHEQLQCTYPAAARRCLETLHPDSVEWRGVSGRDRRREGLGGRDRYGVLVIVGPDAVAVLEVDAQILDRLGVQLAA